MDKRLRSLSVRRIRGCGLIRSYKGYVTYPFDPRSSLPNGAVGGSGAMRSVHPNTHATLASETNSDSGESHSCIVHQTAAASLFISHTTSRTPTVCYLHARSLPTLTLAASPIWCPNTAR